MLAGSDHSSDPPVHGLTNSSESKRAFTARLWPRFKSPSVTADFDCSINCLIWLTISYCVALSSCPAIFFRFSSVAAVSCSVVKRSYEACSVDVSPLSSTIGSSDPPFLITTIGGGHGFTGIAPPPAGSAGAE